MIKKNIGISELVNLLYNTGDLISNNNSNFVDGIKYHKHIQGKYLEKDLKEVYVNDIVVKDNYEYNFNGRIDGVLFRNENVLINEIKTTRIDVNNINELIKINHLYQAMLYSYMYLKQNNLSGCLIRITYVNIISEQIREFDFNYVFSDLENFFLNTCDEFHKFNRIIEEYQNNKFKAIENLKFPFSTIRKGQKELILYNLDNIKNSNIIYIVAPTGIGKTISLLYSSIKSLKEQNEKIFYLTSKNSLKKIALSTIEILKKSKLDIKTIELTSKEKICFLKENKDCKNCVYNENYYNKLYPIIVDAFKNYHILSKEVIESLAFKYTVCPFELSLDLSNYQDIIISDYNYAFCPKSHLIRYFETNDFSNILLVDESHNLVSRSQNMYSSILAYSDILKLKELSYYLSNYVLNKIGELIFYFKYKSTLNNFFVKNDLEDELIFLINDLTSIFEELMDNEKLEENEKQITSIYFNLKEFSKISSFYNSNFKMVFDKTENDFYIKIMCLDASDYILNTINNFSKSVSFFSATMSPLQYYKTLLTKGEGEEIIFNSNFDVKNFLVINYKDIDMTYVNRKNSIDKINDLVKEVTQIKSGNYICFFPSYDFMEEVYEKADFKEKIYLQERNNSQMEKEVFIEKFLNDENHKIGFFVIGSSFSEGIDYIGDKLIGVFIFSLCLPQFNQYNNMNKDFYDEKFSNGYDYAYKFKSLEKVIQASGRVIRSEDDFGFCILVDPRFDSYQYKKYLPNNFKNYSSTFELDVVKNKIKEFFDSKKKDNMI